MSPRKSKTIERATDNTNAMPVVVESSAKISQTSVHDAKTDVNTSNRSTLLLGGGMLLLGALMLAGQFLDVRMGSYVWPFIFIIPGIVILLSAISSDSSSSEGFVILGSILTMLGLIFFAQTVLNLWASWAYAWALLTPTSIGIGQMIYGTRKQRDGIVQTGKHLITIGLTIFAVGFIFFELILNISNIGFARFGLPTFPIALILLGVFILARALIQKR